MNRVCFESLLRVQGITLSEAEIETYLNYFNNKAVSRDIELTDTDLEQCSAGAGKRSVNVSQAVGGGARARASAGRGRRRR